MQANSRILKRLREARKGAVDTIVAGGVSDWASYREKVGYIRGIDDAIKQVGEANIPTDDEDLEDDG